MRETEKRQTIRGRAAAWGVVATGLLLLAAESGACPVCFGESDDPIIKGLESSIVFMVGITYSLILGGLATFFLLRRRARRLAEPTVEKER